MGGYIAYYNSTKSKSTSQIKFKEVIQKELKVVGKLVVLEGVTQYTASQEEATKIPGTSIEIGNRTVDMDLQFKYGYAIDLASINVEVGKEIILIVDNKTIVLDYIYLDQENSTIESKASLLVKGYTSEEINDMQKACTLNVKDETSKNQENILKAKASLEKQLNLIVSKIANRQAIIMYK